MNNTTTNLKLKKRFAGSYVARCGDISFRIDKWDSSWAVRAWVGGEDLRYQEIKLVSSIKQAKEEIEHFAKQEALCPNFLYEYGIDPANEAK
jgi:hypothetical protein